MNIKVKTIIFLLLCLIAPDMQAQTDTIGKIDADTLFYRSQPIIRKNTITGLSADEVELVKVGKDTVSIVIPQKNYGRFDRGLFNYLYAPKGHWAFGITASYGKLDTEDVRVLSMLQNVDFKGKLYSLNPSISYFFNNNQSIGMRLSYSKGMADLANLSLDIDDDMSFSLHDVSYYSQNYNLGVFYRYYVGLSKDKRFAVFNEASIDFTSGSSRFKRYYNEVLYDTYTTSRGANFNFSPGVCVFMHQYAAFNVSFGVFGLKFTRESQKTNGEDEGTRFSSGANFKFNLFNINFGLMIFI